MSDVIKVGMADLNICVAPDSITTLGLGSCVGVVLFDSKIKLGGLAHIMLPDSTQIKNNTNKAKFADTGIEKLIELLVSKGASLGRLKAKIAGGAQMFSFSSGNELGGIGEKNIQATKKILLQHNIPIISSDVGMNYGRTIVFDPETSVLEIRAVGKEITTI